MANDPPFATLNHVAGDLGIPSESALLRIGISLIFSLAFALAVLLEIAGGWQETTRPYRPRLLQAFSFVLGVIVLAAVAYREGWEAVLFLLIFLAICNSAPNPMPQPNFLFLKLHDTPRSPPPAWPSYYCRSNSGSLLGPVAPPRPTFPAKSATQT